jgi:titin
MTVGTSSSGLSPLKVTGLPNGSTYVCGITASQGAGVSKASVSLALAATATTPSITQAQPGDGQIVLSFSPNAESNVAYTGSCISGTSVSKGSDGKVTVTGLANGTAYACTVVATNSSNVSVTSASTSVTPLAQAALGGPIPGDGQVTLNFTKPSTNPSGTLYTASCATSETNWASGTSPLKVTGLANGSVYVCGITASKGAGVSKAWMTVGLPATPGTPSITQAAPGDAQIVLSFSPNAESGVGYTGSCISGKSFDKGSDGKVTVTGLTNGTAYTCTVTATNSANASATSVASTSTTPLAPATLITPATGDVQVTLSFTKPSTNPSSTLYTASCATNDANWSSGTTVGTGSSGLSPLKVTGLANGSMYVCGITSTLAGKGGTKASVSVELPVPANAPSAPASATLSSRCASTMQVTNIVPAGAGGSAITGYKFDFYSVNGSTVAWVSTKTVNSPAPIARFSGEYNTTYRAKIAAINAFGTGPVFTTEDASTPRIYDFGYSCTE